MKKRPSISTQTRNNWWVDFILFASGIAVFLSGVYFLIFPVGGYKGGRNPLYGIIIFFERHTWGDIHIWGSVIMLAVAALHIPLHWKWIANMTKRSIRISLGQAKMMNSRSTFNLVVNAILGLSALIVTFSGLYFLWIPGAAHSSELTDPKWLFTLPTWDIIHTWSGIVMIAMATLHFDIHWKWVTKITKKILSFPTVTSPKKKLAKSS